MDFGFHHPYNEGMSGDLLRTKLTRPPLRAAHVPRPHLITRLNQGLDGKLTLISAPAGFGKTTVVTEWLSRDDLPVAWFTIDEDDSDPVRFLRYLIACLQTINHALGEQAALALAGGQLPPLKTVINALINDLGDLDGRLILVLDDYHLLRSPTIHDLLAHFVAHQPSQLHLVIATREDPPLPLPRWRARAILTEIRERDLRFSAEEATTLLNEVAGLDLSAVQINKLASKTEGWVSGLQLASLSLRGRSDIDGFVESFAGSNRFVLDYLIEEVFRQQPEAIRHFLMETSILDRLCAPPL